MTERSELNLKEIGARFRSVRSLVNINRKTFCERHDINRYTLQSWENGLHISKGKNIEKFIEALAKEGISCNIDWLIDGRGESPKPFGQINQKQLEKPSTKDILIHEPDIEILKKILDSYAHKEQEALMMKVADDHMAPKFVKGDVVIGLRAQYEISLLHQKDCIVDLGLNRLVVRRALIFKDRIMLLALDQTQPTFHLGLEARLFPIIWHWVSN